MSHGFGAMCGQHGLVMVPDHCTEDGAVHQHGYTEVACGPACPEYAGEPDGGGLR